MELYNLLPSIFKYKDGIAIGNSSLSTEEGTLEKIFDAIQNEVDTSADLVEGLKQLIDADEADAKYLPFLSRFLGVSFVSTWTEARRRLFLRSLVLFYFQSGQHELWKALLRFLGHPGAEILELWKSEIYATGGYTADNSDDYYDSLYHAARVDLLLQYSGPVSVVNALTGTPVFLVLVAGYFKLGGALYSGTISVVLTTTGLPIVLNVVLGVLQNLSGTLYNGSITITNSVTGAPVFISSQDGISISGDGTLSRIATELIDEFRPIHVLIRTQDYQTEMSDGAISFDSDSIVPGAGLAVVEELDDVSDSCFNSCETFCEAFCEAGSCEGSFELTLTCVASCEVSCQSACEVGCETGEEVP